MSVETVDLLPPGRARVSCSRRPHETVETRRKGTKVFRAHNLKKSRSISASVPMRLASHQAVRAWPSKRALVCSERRLPVSSVRLSFGSRSRNRGLALPSYGMLVLGHDGISVQKLMQQKLG